MLITCLINLKYPKMCGLLFGIDYHPSLNQSKNLKNKLNIDIVFVFGEKILIYLTDRLTGYMDYLFRSTF